MVNDGVIMANDGQLIMLNGNDCHDEDRVVSQNRGPHPIVPFKSFIVTKHFRGTSMT